MPSLTGTTVFDELLLEATLESNQKYLPRSAVSSTTHILPFSVNTNSQYELKLFATNDAGSMSCFTVYVSRQTSNPVIVEGTKNGNILTFTVTGVGNTLTVTLSVAAYLAYFFMKIA